MALVKKDAAGRLVSATPWGVLDAGQSVPASGPVLIPLATWLDGRDALRVRSAPTGVWLAAGELLSAWGDTLDEDLAFLDVIAVEFAVFGDGRGYSIARLLRERHGYTRELRAIGDVLPDQIVAFVRAGFDAFEVKGTAVDVTRLADALARFPAVYQGAADDLAPIFRRRREAASSGRAAK